MTMVRNHILEHFAGFINRSDICERAWFMIPGKAGPNAILKLIVPPVRSQDGYVLSIARHATTAVVQHEVDILRRLQSALPERLHDSIPTVLCHDKIGGHEYLVTPFYQSPGNKWIMRRVFRNRHWSWLQEWLREIAVHTSESPLSAEWLRAEYAETIMGVETDPHVSEQVKQTLRDHFELIIDNASRIPSVCCHGDLWRENILWRQFVSNAVVLDWGAARWPGLPVVDLCRYALNNPTSDVQLTDSINRYCRLINLDPRFVPALYDLYNVFIKAELDEAFATQSHAKINPFLHGLPSQRISQVLSLTL